MAFTDAIQVRNLIFNLINRSPFFLIIIASCTDVGPINPIMFSILLCIHMLEMYIFECSIVIFLKEWKYQVKVAFNCHIYFHNFEFMVVFFMLIVSIVLLLAHMLLVAHLIFISFIFSYSISV